MIPDFYANTLAAVREALGRVRKAQVWEFGRSGGDRPLHAVAYGEKEALTRTANFSAAMAGNNPKAFFGEGRQKQVLMVMAAIHGGEMEGIAGMLNLIHLMETGSDLRGREWPALLELMQRLRLIIIPCANPDGREHVPTDDPQSHSPEQLEVLYQGTWSSGEAIGWIPSKSFNPLPLDRVGLLGGYFNDNGVNLLHGAFLPREVAPESHALLALALEETPDMVLDLHSCGAGPFCIVGGHLIPEWANARTHYFDAVVRSLLRERGLGAKPWTVPGLSPEAPDLDDLFYGICGAIPMVFEGPHGMDPGNHWSYDQIVDMYLTVVEALGQVGVHERFRTTEW